MSKIKLVMADLDGTIVLKGNEITDTTIKAIDDLIDKGIEFVPATGRYLNSIPDYFINHPKINYIVSSNGALISKNSTKDPISAQTMDFDESLEILQLAHDKADDAFVVTNKGVLMERRIFDMHTIDNPEIAKIFLATTVSVDNLIDHIKDNDLNLKKIQFGFEDLDIRNKFYEVFKKYKSFNIVSSSDSNIEITSKAASKGSALHYLIDYLDLSAEQILAIGDSENDISMLKEAGLAIAMGNSTDNVIKNSDFITDDAVDDGFSKAIKKVFSK